MKVQLKFLNQKGRRSLSKNNLTERKETVLQNIRLFIVSNFVAVCECVAVTGMFNNSWSDIPTYENKNSGTKQVWIDMHTNAQIGE